MWWKESLEHSVRESNGVWITVYLRRVGRGPMERLLASNAQGVGLGGWVEASGASVFAQIVLVQAFPMGPTCQPYEHRKGNPPEHSPPRTSTPVSHCTAPCRPKPPFRRSRRPVHPPRTPPIRAPPPWLTRWKHQSSRNPSRTTLRRPPPPWPTRRRLQSSPNPNPNRSTHRRLLLGRTTKR